MEALLLEEKLLMVNERKVRDDLRVADDAMLELNRQVKGTYCKNVKNNPKSQLIQGENGGLTQFYVILDLVC